MFETYVNLSTYRIKNWWYYLGYPLLGFAFAGSFDGWFVILPLTILILAHSYSMNERYDRNMKGYDFLIPILISLLFVPFLNIYQIFCFISIITISFSYSHPAIHFKSKPFVVTILNGMFFSLFFSLAYLQIAWPDILMFRIFGLLSFFNIGAQLIHELSHQNEDLSEDINTTAVYLGEKRTTLLLVFSMICGIAYSFYLFIVMVLSSVELFLILSFWVSSILLVKRCNWVMTRRIYRYAGMVVGGLIFLLKITF
jgi:4-hydroxybenzoate polyprenyltransferase